MEDTSHNKKAFKILVWRFGGPAKRKYVNGYTSQAKGGFPNLKVTEQDRGRAGLYKIIFYKFWRGGVVSN